MEAAYTDRETAPVSPQTRAALAMIEKMTSGRLTSNDLDEVRRAGVDDEAITDALTICALFNVIDRLADAFEFHVPDRETFDRGSASLLKRGYALPAPVVWLAQD